VVSTRLGRARGVRRDAIAEDGVFAHERAVRADVRDRGRARGGVLLDDLSLSGVGERRRNQRRNQRRRGEEGETATTERRRGAVGAGARSKVSNAASRRSRTFALMGATTLPRCDARCRATAARA